MSRAGKKILIKAVIQAISSYVMSVFLLPKRLCEEPEKLMNKFWWVSNMENNRGSDGCAGINYVIRNFLVEWVFEESGNSI